MIIGYNNYNFRCTDRSVPKIIVVNRDEFRIQKVIEYQVSVNWIKVYFRAKIL